MILGLSNALLPPSCRRLSMQKPASWSGAFLTACKWLLTAACLQLARLDAMFLTLTDRGRQEGRQAGRPEGEGSMHGSLLPLPFCGALHR